MPATNFYNFHFIFLDFNRQQKEREIRHKIKKGDLADIPKEVLETMAPSLLMPAKGMDWIFCTVKFVLFILFCFYRFVQFRVAV